MRELRLGISPCPNDVFVFAGLILGKVPMGEWAFLVDYQDVENLNQAAQEEAFDVVKVSYANLLRIENNYELLASGGALGRNCGPLLLVNGKEYQPEREILIPGEFTTANFLLDFYLRQPVLKRAMTFDVLYEHLLANPGSQGVVIHEKRFTYERDGLTLVRDLGEHWEAQTGFPIPLGGIAIRKSLGLYAPVNALIRESLRWAWANEKEALNLCRQYAQDMSDPVMKAHIGLYVNAFSDDLGAEGWAAVRFFRDTQRTFLARTK